MSNPAPDTLEYLKRKAEKTANKITQDRRRRQGKYRRPEAIELRALLIEAFREGYRTGQADETAFKQRSQ